MSNTTELFGSGTRSWFDYDPGIKASNISSELDIQDVLSSVYAREHTSAPRINSVPATSLYSSNCDFDVAATVGSASSGTGCDITSITDNVITSDPFIMSQVVKQIIVNKEDVEYFTYNSSGTVVPVVTKCDVSLQIWGTPEVAAIRFRNEEDETYSKWCPWTPTIGDYYTEVEHTLSFDSGSKEVCVQIMTYNGVTMETCVPVIADYRKIVFELQMFADEDRKIPLPFHNGAHVAALALDGDGIIQPIRTVYIDMIPSETVNADKINFDVLQQGDGDQLDIEALVISGDKQIFRGQFDIFREDNISHLDGVARIRAKLPGSCEKITEGFVTSSFTRDKFNLMNTSSQSEQEDAGEVLANYRQEISGRIGVGVVLRPSNDPYLIFGDPDYFSTQKEPIQKGVISEGVFSVNTGGTGGDPAGGGDPTGGGTDTGTG